MSDTGVHGAAISYRVPDELHTGGRRGLAALLVAAAVMWLLSVAAYAPVKVTVDGVARTVPVGTTVEGLVSSRLVKASNGYLLSVTG